MPCSVCSRWCQKHDTRVGERSSKRGIVSSVSRAACSRATIASLQGAVCLDGSAPGYYIGEGSGSGARKWILHQGGGGWCNSNATCLDRSKTPLGSSYHWTASVEIGGIFSDNATVNGEFHNWNVVYLGYCDGASFSGYRWGGTNTYIMIVYTVFYPTGETLSLWKAPNCTSGHSTSTATVYESLSTCLIVLIYYLQGKANTACSCAASSATWTAECNWCPSHWVLRYQSDIDLKLDMIASLVDTAGGLATYLHADLLPALLPKGIKYRAMADAG